MCSIKKVDLTWPGSCFVHFVSYCRFYQEVVVAYPLMAILYLLVVIWYPPLAILYLFFYLIFLYPSVVGLYVLSTDCHFVPTSCRFSTHQLSFFLPTNCCFVLFAPTGCHFLPGSCHYVPIDGHSVPVFCSLIPTSCYFLPVSCYFVHSYQLLFPTWHLSFCTHWLSFYIHQLSFCTHQLLLFCFVLASFHLVHFCTHQFTFFLPGSCFVHTDGLASYCLKPTCSFVLAQSCLIPIACHFVSISYHCLVISFCTQTVGTCFLNESTSRSNVITMKSFRESSGCFFISPTDRWLRTLFSCNLGI